MILLLRAAGGHPFAPPPIGRIATLVASGAQSTKPSVGPARFYSTMISCWGTIPPAVSTATALSAVSDRTISAVSPARSAKLFQEYTFAVARLAFIPSATQGPVLPTGGYGRSATQSIEIDGSHLFGIVSMEHSISGMKIFIVVETKVHG